MADFHKERFTLEQMMAAIGASWTGEVEPFITYDPNVVPQYHIIRGQAHDGTVLFTRQLMHGAMAPLFLRQSYYKHEPIPEGMVPVYTIGTIKLATVYGAVDIPAGRYPGQRERIRIPVRVAWVPCAAPQEEKDKPGNGKGSGA